MPSLDQGEEEQGAQVEEHLEQEAQGAQVGAHLPLAVEQQVEQLAEVAERLEQEEQGVQVGAHLPSEVEQRGEPPRLLALQVEVQAWVQPLGLVPAWHSAAPVRDAGQVAQAEEQVGGMLPGGRPEPSSNALQYPATRTHHASTMSCQTRVAPTLPTAWNVMLAQQRYPLQPPPLLWSQQDRLAAPAVMRHGGRNAQQAWECLVVGHQRTLPTPIGAQILWSPRATVPTRHTARAASSVRTSGQERHGRQTVRASGTRRMGQCPSGPARRSKTGRGTSPLTRTHGR